MTQNLNSVYNLKAVLHETGIKPDVLRAWERRYGLPMPERTAGGHRQYSWHDIEIIKWLMQRQNEGLSISHAVDMWKEKMVNGHDPQGVAHSGGAAISPQGRPALLQADTGALTGIHVLRSQWVSACLRFNEIMADQALNQAFALYPVEEVCTALLQRGLAEIGAMWYESSASVQQEHFASALALRRLDALLIACPVPTRPENIIVGCPANEWHTFTPLLIALLIRRRGYNVIYLGANVPASHFIETIEAVKAGLVVLAAQQLQTAATLMQSAAMISAYGIKVAYGGRVFALHPDLLARIAGHYLGNKMEGAMDDLENFLPLSFTAPSISLPSADYVDTLNAFNVQRAFIDASLNLHLGPRGSQDANKYLGDNIAAALELGDMRYLESDIDWLKVLIESQKLPGSLLSDYLKTYSEVVKQFLPEHAQPISQWFERHLSLDEI